MKNLCEQLIYARKKAKLTQQDVASKLEVTRQTYSAYERGITIPSLETIEKISNLLNCSVGDILPSSFPVTKKIGVKIPVLGYIRAGIPHEAIENIIDYEEISEELSKKGDFFALCVSGDSMKPRIHPGDIVIVKKQNTIETGDIGVILVNGDDATIKKVVVRGNALILVPENPQYEQTIFTEKDIEELPVEIIGRVVELRAKL